MATREAVAPQAVPMTAPDRRAAGGVRPAHRHVGRRIAAFAIDTCLLVVLISLVAALLAVVLGPAIDFAATSGPVAGRVAYDARLAAVTAAAGIAAGGAYFCLSWLRVGATPGQWLLRLAVRGADGDARVTVGQALARWTALGAPLWIASSMVPGWAGVVAALAGGAWAVGLLVTTARSPMGRGWHDRLSGTRVVRVASTRQLPSRTERHVR